MAQHANFLEHQPSFLAALLIGGLGYPVSLDIILKNRVKFAELFFQKVSAGLGLGWCAARVLYALGYVNKDKPDGRGRTIGNWFWFPEFCLQIAAGLFGYKILTEGR